MKKIKLAVVFVFVSSFLVFKFSTVSPTVSGQASLSAPTGVTATDGIYSTKIGLHWDTMRGAASYRIFRNTTNNPATATDRRNDAANTFFDSTAVQDKHYFYWIRSENGSATSSLSQSRTGHTRQRKSWRRYSAASTAECTAGKSDNRHQSIARQSTFLGRTAFLDAHGRLRNLSFGQRRRN